MYSAEQTLKNLAKGKKLLLVEDDKKTLDVLKSFLSKFFSLVKTASNGDEAWEMYRKEHFDLVISDIEMPGTNGVMLSKGIKARNPEQAVLITSAYTDEKYLVELINIGVDGFLKKPINIKNLHDTIIRVLKFVQIRMDAYRVKFKAITSEITHKEIKVTKSNYQKAIEKDTKEEVKTTVKEFMSKIKNDDPESYEFFETQKELLMDTLHEMVDNYEMFAYKNYTEADYFNELIDDMTKLYHTLILFDKVKDTTAQILRLADILKTIDLNNLDDEQSDAFDMLEFLVNDIKQFILDMFFEENVKDINYFKDSFRENITTFENALMVNHNDEDDEIEFL